MEELLKKIIEIEHQAQSLVAEGIAEKENMYKATRNEIEDLKSSILEMSEHKIEELRLRNERDAEEKINQINESRTQKLKMLEETYNKNREQWENQIFTRIIGR